MNNFFFNVIASSITEEGKLVLFIHLLSPNENDCVLESHFAFHRSSNQYLLSVHYVHDKILGSRK